MVYNDYYQCIYNNNPNQLIRESLFDSWEINFDLDKIEKRKVKTFKEEVLNSCELIYDNFKNYTPKLNLFYSGGIDSECMVRCFNELKIPINPIIIIHKYRENFKETTDALKLCKKLNLTPTIFELDLVDMYKKGIFNELGKKYQTGRVGMLELIYILEKIQEPAILADDIQLNYKCPEKLIVQKNETDFRSWLYEVREDEDGVFDRYRKINQIPTIADFFRYTPYSWAAMIMSPKIVDIVTNNRGKASSLTTKNSMMSQEFKVPYREKTTIFLDQPYRLLDNKLQREMALNLYPYTTIEIEYNELLNILIGNKNEI